MGRPKSEDTIKKEKEAQLNKYGFDYNTEMSKSKIKRELESHIITYKRWIENCNKEIEEIKKDVENEELAAIEQKINDGLLSTEKLQELLNSRNTAK